VGEAWVRPDRVDFYADPQGLGYCFSFDIMFTAYDAQAYKRGIQTQYERVKQSSSSMTWVLSNHHGCRTKKLQLTPVHPSTQSICFTTSKMWSRTCRGGNERVVKKRRKETLLRLGERPKKSKSCYITTKSDTHVRESPTSTSPATHISAHSREG
jgi:hypothetical protein